MSLLNVDFNGADLLSVAAGRSSSFERCSFDGTDLRQATLDGGFFKFCSFRGARMNGASFRGAQFAGCDLTGVDFAGCDVSGAKFGYVNTGADNGRTILRGAKFSAAQILVAEFDRVVGLPSNSHPVKRSSLGDR